ncbi:MAG: hypothetical protein FWF94_08335 [Oscillospiraceae bacterium]|nr:hypothetical protein [Oscillospiraceae bacterium]
MIKRRFLTPALAFTLAFSLMLGLAARYEPASAAAPVRYEAENATRTNDASVENSAAASGGKYVSMREGNLSFSVTVPSAGFYTVWVGYSLNDPSKEQDIRVNGSVEGKTVFTRTTNSAVTFVEMVLLQKVKLNNGANTIEIIKNWGWVDIDYIAVGEFEATPFSIDTAPINPKASANTKKLYTFLRENFQNKVISGVMTDSGKNIGNDGKALTAIEPQVEVAFIKSSSSKTPALLGFDFMHGTGKGSDGSWYKENIQGAINMAEDLWKKGGISTFSWHWRDPSGAIEDFYTNKVSFDANAVFNTSSSEYKAMINDIDIVAGYLKKLADKDVPVLWRPLHEAAGGWFWWGAKGPAANKALWALMYDRLTNHHNLNNLIWVWTCEENANALEWYPGDQYVDIVGRDFYYPDGAGQKNHGSLMASFEHLKELYKGKKIIALSENGSVPYGENLVADGAGWSWFMPWYGAHTGIGSSAHNTASDWNKVMNHSYVLTLESMPGWSSYNPNPDSTTATTPATTVTAATSPVTDPTTTVTTATLPATTITTPIPNPAGVLYDMQNVALAEFEHLNGSGGSSGTNRENDVLVFNGDTNMQVATIAGPPRMVNVSARASSSHGVRIQTGNIPGIVADKDYEFEITGRFDNPTSDIKARLRVENDARRPIGSVPLNTDGTFTLKLTVSGDIILQDAAAGAVSAAQYSIGNEGSSFPDMTITGVIIREVGSSAATTTVAATTTNDIASETPFTSAVTSDSSESSDTTTAYGITSDITDTADTTSGMSDITSDMFSDISSDISDTTKYEDSTATNTNTTLDTADTTADTTAPDVTSSDFDITSTTYGITSTDIATTSGIGDISSDISDTTSPDITTTAPDITTTEPDITTTTQDITTTEPDITTTEPDITTTTPDITTTASDITTTAPDITTTTQDITTVTDTNFTSDTVATTAETVPNITSDTGETTAATDSSVSSDSSSTSATSTSATAPTTTIITEPTIPQTTTATPPPVKFGILSAEGLAAGEPTIFCFMEILLDLVGMSSNATDNPAAILSPQGRQAGKPTIFCAIEILQFLVGMTPLDMLGK